MTTREFEMDECLNHQDIAKALGLPDPRQFGQDEIGYFKSLGGRCHISLITGKETHQPIGYAFLYTGALCPLCHPDELLVKANQYRSLKNPNRQDGFAQSTGKATYTTRQDGFGN